MNYSFLSCYSVFFLFFVSVHVDLSSSVWNAQTAIEHSLVNAAHQKKLNNPLYTILKSKVLTDLQGSWCSDEKATLIMDLVLLEQPKNCVEIGVFTGSSLLPLLISSQFYEGANVYAIDPWSNEATLENLDPESANGVWWSKVDMDGVYSSFETMLREWDLHSRCTVIRKSSKDAISFIQEIDFLHIDGNFTNSGRLEDSVLYLPKVKSGGFILISSSLSQLNPEDSEKNAFCYLLDHCQLISRIDGSRGALFKKI